MRAPLPVVAVHPESPRYGVPLVFLPGLWSGPGVWQRAAGLLAHRGWQGWIVDPAGRGGVGARADALAALLGELGAPPVLVASDGAGVVAAEAARRTAVAAFVWVAPLVPGGAALRRLVSPWAVLAGLVLGRPVARPAAWSPEAAGAAWLRPVEDAALVVDLVRARVSPRALGVPTLLAAGEHDRRSAEDERAALAHTLGADRTLLAGAGGAPLVAGDWQAHAGAVHRWLVTRLGEPLLELYAEAMAERDEE